MYLHNILCLGAAMCHFQSDCFFCVIFADQHSSGFKLFEAWIKLIMKSSNCPTLQGKPKVFIVQVLFYIEFKAFITKDELESTISCTAGIRYIRLIEIQM